MYTSQLVLVKRRLTGNFTQIPNSTIRDNSISSRSLGILVHLLSLPAKNFHISLEGVCQARDEGETLIRSAIRQLESQGYMKIVRERSSTGRYVRSRWLVSDTPIMDWAPYLENPAVEEPVVGNKGTTNTVLVETPNSTITTTAQPPLSATIAPVEIDDDGDKEIWSWLCEKVSIDPQQTRRKCAGLSTEVALDILAEVYAIQRQNGIKKSVSQFMSALLRKAREGKFNLSAGAPIRKEIPMILHRQKELQAVSRAVTATPTQETLGSAIPPRERLQQLRDGLSKRTAISNIFRGEK